MIRPRIASAVTDQEAERLAELAAGKVVLEVGAGRGFSAIIMARTAAVVHSVDWHRGDAHAREGDTLPGYWGNLGRYRVRDRVVSHVGDLRQVLPLLRPASFGFAFLDGFHEIEAVIRDAGLIAPLLTPGALLAFHDYGRFGVRQAVERLRFELIDVTGTLAVTRP